MITFNNVSKRYEGGQDALSQISFHLDTGEMAFLTGHSGAGKSTLLKLAALIERSSAGDVIVNNQALAKMSLRQLPFLRRSMGVIFQSPKLLYDRLVFDNVALPLVISGENHREIGKRVRAALDLVGLLSKEKMSPKHLSSGERQRVGIARAVVHKPKVILADEPTGNLDPSLSKEIMRLFSKLNTFGVTILVATHDLGLIASMRHRILTLKDGRMS